MSRESEPDGRSVQQPGREQSRPNQRTDDRRQHQHVQQRPRLRPRRPPLPFHRTLVRHAREKAATGAANVGLGHNAGMYQSYASYTARHLIKVALT